MVIFIRNDKLLTTGSASVGNHGNHLIQATTQIAHNQQIYNTLVFEHS